MSFELGSIILEIDGVKLTPYKFEESYDDGLTMYATVKLNNEEMKKLRQLHHKDGYFKVIRHDRVGKQELSMRFGQNVWSEHKDFFKVNLILVEESCDLNSSKGNMLFEPEMSNIKRMLAYEKNLNNELIELLLTKEIVNEEEIKTIKEKAEKDIRNTYDLFLEVKDVDEF